MNNKRTGAILLSGAGLTAAISMAGAQIAKAIVLSGFYAGNKSGVVPLGPEAATLPRLIILVIVVLTIAGGFFLLMPEKK